jgi:hypothetical protein
VQVAGRWRSAALLAGGIGLGVAVAVGVPALSGADDTARPAPAASTPEDLLDLDRVEVDGPRIRTPTAREAVEEFLAAEKAGDDERSFGLLSDALRQEYGGVAEWRADANAVPPVLGFEVEDAPADEGGSAVVLTTTRFRSSLDSVAGLVPARARTSWAVVQEEGGWAVDLDASTQEVLLPPESGIPAAVQEWVRQRQQCVADDSVRGSPSLAQALCGTSGTAETGDAAPLDPLDVGALQSSFGSDVAAWGRALDVASPVPLRAVLAPLDDRWQVVAVLPAPSDG